MTRIMSSPLYADLDESRDEIRLLTLLPESRAAGVIHCTLQTHSLADFTPEYQRFVSDPDVETQGKRTITSRWIQSRMRPDFSGLPALGRLHAAQPPSSHHRFAWGDYVALSYAWGDDSDTRAIVMNGRSVRVTVSLVRVLWAFVWEGKFEDGLKLWVDAVCINQDNLDERARQLRRMRGIYGSAWSVIAWLGEESFRSNSAFRLVRDLAALSGAGCGGEIEARLRAEPDYLGKGCWLALQELIERPYWSRLWVIQEMIMGASATWVMCGHASIDWATFVAGIAFLEEHLWFVKDSLLWGERRSLLGESATEPKTSNLPWSVTTLHLIYSDLSPLGEREERGGSYPSFVRLLDIANSANCIDPRDKVYGLIALMSPQLASRLKLGYTLSVPSVYSATTRAFIETDDNLDPILEGNPWGPSNGPSWAADWLWSGRLRWGRPSAHVWGPPGLFPRPGADGASSHVPYRASGDTRHTTQFSSDGLLLSCDGFIVDRINGLSARGTSYFTWDEDSIVQPERWTSVYGDWDSTAEALYRTLVMDRVAGGGKATERHAAILSLPTSFRVDGQESEFAKRGWSWLAGQERYYVRWEKFRALNKYFQLGHCYLDDFFKGRKMPQDASEYDYSEVFSCFDRSFIKKRFMATANGYLGWAPDNIFGHASQSTKPGDLIAVLFGCSAPVVIRPFNTHFQVIGEAYVQGIMEGEALEGLHAGKFKSQRFTFC